MVSSVIKPPKWQLKPLFEHLKYGYLGAKNTLPIIFPASLDKDYEESILNVLKWHKKL